ncbi:hypothetical protein NL676_036383 [Syzygium grande]|nr:hypothetical protein NL676_036383 [Syzygium grande]
MEKLNGRSLGSIAKTLGTVVCVGGAIVLTLLRGPKLLNAESHLRARSIFAYEVITLFLEQDPEAWKIHSKLGIAAVLYAGIVGSGISYFIQLRCVSQRAPLFSSTFTPLSTVIVIIFGAIFLHEEIYIRGLAGAIGLVAGLCLVLWSTVKDIEINEETRPKLQIDCAHTVKSSGDESLPEKLSSSKCHLSEPLLSDKSADETSPV